MTSSPLVKKFSYPPLTLNLHLRNRDPSRNFSRNSSDLTPSPKSSPPWHTNSSSPTISKFTLCFTSPCSSGTRPRHPSSLEKSHLPRFQSIFQDKMSLN